jgi:hypothetical protein
MAAQLEQDELDLASQGLTALPLALSPTLRVLNLTRNRLADLSPCGALRHLERLDVSRNKIRVLPEAVASLPRLEELLLYSNHLRRNGLPKEITAPLSLLDLRFNQKLTGDVVRDEIQATMVSGTVLVSPRKAPLPPAGEGDCAGSRDASTLEAQLQPWSTPQLRRRLAGFSVATDPEAPRAVVMALLLTAYLGEGLFDMRRIRRVRPRKQVAAQTASALFAEVKRTQFLVTNTPGHRRERPRVDADLYITFQAPNTTFRSSDGTFNAESAKAKAATLKRQRHQQLWDLAVEALREADPQYASTFTSLAITGNFKGSPHIDTENVAPFYALALGDFTGGGRVAVESGERQVTEVDTRFGFAKVDGRFPHWVTPYRGERFSLIYYTTEGPAAPVLGAVVDEAVVDEGCSE